MMALVTKSQDDSVVPDLLSDCRLMLRYARKNAFDLSPELVSAITLLDSILKQRGFDPVSDVDVALVSGAPSLIEALQPAGPPLEPGGVAAPAAAPSVAPVTPPPGAEEMILKVHGELSKVIAPTTALTLQASEPPPGKHRFFGGMPLIVKAAAIAALVSAGLFVMSAGIIAQKAADAKKELAIKKEGEQASKKKAMESQSASAEARQASQSQAVPSAPAGNEKGAKP